jgi:RNA polymerase sigma factor (sigma-70 family)
LLKDFDSNKIQYRAFMEKLSYKWRFFFNREEREQIANIALWKSMQKYNPEKAKFITFLGRTLKWEFLDNWNAEKQPKDIVTLSVITNLKNEKKELIPMSMSVMDNMNIDNKDMVEEIAKRLTSKRKQIFMCLLEGKNMIQISKELSITSQRVQQLINHIKKTAEILKIKEGY